MPKVTYFTRYPIAGVPKITYFTWSGQGVARKKPEGGQEKPEGAGKAIGSILEPFRRKNAGFAKQCVAKAVKYDVSRMGVAFCP